MAARFNVQEVRDEVMQDSDDDRSVDEVAEEVDSDREKVAQMLDNFSGGDGFDEVFFKREAVDLLLPLARLSRQLGEKKLTETDNRVNGTHLHLREGTLPQFTLLPATVNVVHVLSSMKISAGSVLDCEARLWLKQIYRRLSGKVSTRRPYYAEIHRNIPYAVFNAIQVVIQQCPDMIEPVCYSVKNKKGHVITFTTKASVVQLFGLMAGLGKEDVEGYFKRELKVLIRNRHKVKLIVEDVKDFAFVYQFSKGSLTIQFHYGEWNKHNYPRHSCQLKKRA